MDNIKKLNVTMPTMSEEDRQLAELYIERIAKMQALFRFAQLMITTILARVAESDLQGISRIELG